MRNPRRPKFPNVVRPQGSALNNAAATWAALRDRLHMCSERHVEEHHACGSVRHVFSHIKHTYLVHDVPLGLADPAPEARTGSRWVTREELHATAVPTGMKKVLRLFDARADPDGVAVSKRRRKTRTRKVPPDGQSSISQFFGAAARASSNGHQPEAPARKPPA